MSAIPMRAARRDKVEPEVVAVFRGAGCSVEYLSGKGLPDLLVGKDQVWHLVEVKSGDKAKLTPDQIAWHAACQGEPVQICRSADEARHLLHVWDTAAAVWSTRKP